MRFLELTMKTLKVLMYKLFPRLMCQCPSPNFEVREGILICNRCNKPINRNKLKGAF